MGLEGGEGCREEAGAQRRPSQHRIGSSKGGRPALDGPCPGSLTSPGRVLMPGVMPCFECTLWLFPPQTKFPLCTLAETPRSVAAGCCLCC